MTAVQITQGVVLLGLVVLLYVIVIGWLRRP